MLYFPLIETTLPEWVPFKGGDDFVFFRPIFNIADSCITIGVAYLLLFQRRFFSREDAF
jgi:signal peptidase II